MQLDSRRDLQEHAIVHRIPQRMLYVKYVSSIKKDPRGIGCRLGKNSCPNQMLRQHLPWKVSYPLPICTALSVDKPPQSP